MPEGRPAERRDEGPEGEEPLELDLEVLRAREDIDGALVLARAYRSGAAPGGRDLKRCLDAYRLAAELGSADAEYAVALFTMSGGVVAQDLKEGATRLRAAAEKGSISAKVYLGNLYELGIHYKTDPEKADVWYRNAARSARIVADPGSDAFVRALAELGCVRHVLAIAESGASGEEDKSRLLQRARAHGYGLADPQRSRDDTADRPTLLDALQRTDAVAPAPATDARSTASPARSTSPGRDGSTDVETVEAREGPTRAALALGAFGYGLLFALTGAGAGYAAMLGARELVHHGQALPGLGARADLVFPIVFGVVGVLPAWLVYRFTTVVKALVIGSAIGGIGWVAWGTGQASLAATRPAQALVFAMGGFVAGLCVLGFLGGTKKQPPRAQRRPPATDRRETAAPQRRR